jgi:hypothetical protein
MSASKQFRQPVEFLSTQNTPGYTGGTVYIAGCLNTFDLKVNNTVTIPNLLVTNNLITSNGNLLISSQWNSLNQHIVFTSGNIGIGTTTPGFNLDISGGSRITGSLTTGSLTVLTGCSIPNIFSTTITTASLYSTNHLTTNISSNSLTINSTVSSIKLQVKTTGSVAPVLIHSTNSLTGILFSLADESVNTDIYIKSGILFKSTHHNPIGSLGLCVNTNPDNSNVSWADSKLTINSTGNIGIGTTTPTSTLHVIGNALITGSLSKGSGTFEIKHPLIPNKTLVHSFIEGPRCDNIYRGVSKLMNGNVTVNLDKECTTDIDCAMTEGTFVKLNCNPTCYLQNNMSYDNVIGKIVGNSLIITCSNTVSNVFINWLVIGERQDNYIKNWNRTNQNGYLITEF